MIAAKTKFKPLNPRVADIKFTGLEPEWNLQPSEDNRLSKITTAFTWYNYHYGKKEAKQFITDWLQHHDRGADAVLFSKVSENTVVSSHGWIARMTLMGLELTEHEELTLLGAISKYITAVNIVPDDKVAANVSKTTIQDRLREKMIRCAAELDGLFDEFIASDKSLVNFKPIAVLRTMNVAPVLVNEIVAIWNNTLSEFNEAYNGKDEQLTESYGHLTKAQLKTWIKFAEQVIADCGSYVQLKKVERKPRAKAEVSAEKTAIKFKYLREFTELNIKSEHPAKLVGATEAWLYDVAKRKLIYVIADSHSGAFTIKGSSVIGFDPTASMQKTLRKPAEQIKELVSANIGTARKMYKEIKSVDIKFTGRSNENLIILRVK
jgi:hypothetical protein